MKVAAIGDTYGQLPNINGKFDLFIHCGNFLPSTGDAMVDVMEQSNFIENKFNPWLRNINAKYKIVIPGYSDYLCAYKERDIKYFIDAIFIINELFYVNKNYISGFSYMSHSSLKKYKKGVFFTTTLLAYRKSLSKIDKHTQILITRMPYNDASIKKKISTLKYLKKHIFCSLQDESNDTSINVSYMKEKKFYIFDV